MKDILSQIYDHLSNEENSYNLETLHTKDYFSFDKDGFHVLIKHINDNEFKIEVNYLVMTSYFLISSENVYLNNVIDFVEYYRSKINQTKNIFVKLSSNFNINQEQALGRTKRD